MDDSFDVVARDFKNYFMPFAAGGVAAAAGGAEACSLAGALGATVFLLSAMAVPAWVAELKFKPVTMIPSILIGVGAGAFATPNFNALASETLGNPGTTLTVQGRCKEIQATLAGVNGQQVEIVPSPGCT